MTGLYRKYKIYNNETGEEMTAPSFTLKPVSDPAAREALRVYATFIADDNPDLYLDLVEWINKIEDKHGVYDWEAHRQRHNIDRNEEEEEGIGEDWLNE